ncbi:MAG: ribonuclease T [Pseudomonadales bacterium]|nr:ribonuclease T [Pseudomonadales bacterium]MDP6472015.1 ribonuclease T [Pseudomonadales bacterium]MDP6826712.1 ribonuclease T [Pseudomonadales bacterium]MDP6972646.1 ribonuclease T [Pseudomonadales bacterium]
MVDRFRGFLPVVIDIETGGFDAERCAVLEIAASSFDFEDGQLTIASHAAWAVEPFEGALLDEASLRITGIDPADPERNALPEKDALTDLFRLVRREIKRHGCQRGILVAHNAAFDQQFLKQTVARTGVKRDPFHPFSFIDTASLAAVAYGHTVLAEACARAGIEFDDEQAHSASYDADRTARLFCEIVNRWRYS